MKEIFEKQTHISIEEGTAKDYVLLDTCFFIHTFEHQKDHALRDLVAARDVAMTSFNVDEFLFKEHVVDERVREYARKFLKNNPITIIDIDVHPGNRFQEQEFVKSIDPGLLKEVPDASDAVLIAAAIKTRSTVLTKDKHHLFTTKLENYLNKYEIKVFKEYHDIRL
ncbi:TPA: type II toxin-antitoxin system VapC family toxin [Candidatus Woesearchaeota archaeon]|nr:type II toxin-antitoxin system VapC family toxin [Candidatus Woesearchaeota archaeon]HIH31526.1 type II toxin-antitoxin system VapC family toxin [Candidatus Woesearchaeota archaeon]HIH54316.1 type II toxin-antitoxin system VapC family toxin [Candidatus Woesearchaeota archaeon]HIJ02494.1 type II toxin-antitoxin system VapC family toxin [Candidatus Woesearchaeota archaeon]HIJ13460.1 type II toxin-antitoxin system VapC family toxin [Candidatus Woesearchaeota archaeon]